MEAVATPSIGMERKGAPFQALSLLVACWVLGRILWECLTVTPLLLPMALISTASASGEIDRFSDPVSQPQVRRIQPQGEFSSQARKNAALTPWENKAIHSSSTANPAFEASVSPMESVTHSSEFPAPAMRDEQQLQAGLQIEEKDAQNLPVALNGTQFSDARLAGYFWFFVRQNSGEGASGTISTAPQPLHGQYGGSQAGGHLTYRLFGDHSQNLSVFGRISTALTAQDEEELAIGLKVKPVRDLPVLLHAEQRFGAGPDHVRGTAVYISGGMGPIPVHELASIETYGQAGYKFGRQSTYFYDGSLILEKAVSHNPTGKLSIGAGVWAGGQRGASRLDMGPRAKVDLPTGKLTTRLTLDWRARIAGDAQPGSGIALSLSSGF